MRSSRPTWPIAALGAAGIDFFATSHMPEGCRTLVTNPPYGDGGIPRPGRQGGRRTCSASPSTPSGWRGRHEGQLALLVRFQWIAGKRVASLLTEAKMHSAIVLTRRIRWFDNGGD